MKKLEIVLILLNFLLIGVISSCENKSTLNDSSNQVQCNVDIKRQELIKLYLQWIKADENSKQIIEATIISSFKYFDVATIKDFPDLYDFLITIKNK